MRSSLFHRGYNDWRLETAGRNIQIASDLQAASMTAATIASFNYWTVPTPILILASMLSFAASADILRIPLLCPSAKPLPSVQLLLQPEPKSSVDVKLRRCGDHGKSGGAGNSKRTRQELEAGRSSTRRLRAAFHFEIRRGSCLEKRSQLQPELKSCAACGLWYSASTILVTRSTNEQVGRMRSMNARLSSKSARLATPST